VLSLRPAYLGVVASRKRFGTIRETLLGRGIAASALDAIHNPAGLDLGARLPEEVALSILAEVVQQRRAAAPSELSLVKDPAAADAASAAAAEAIDPICGMTVTIASARHRAEHEGRSYYFCNPRCREKFLAEPARWTAAPAAKGA
jgi:xanthine dehydrogenase accessory factor